MTDIQTLLLNRVRESLERLSREGVGYIDGEDSGGIRYCIDGRCFCIQISEEE